MKIYSKIFPYMLIGLASVMPRGRAENSRPYVAPSFESMPEYVLKDYREDVLLTKKAMDLRDTYVMKSVEGSRNVRANRGRVGYVRAVQKELPGAPVGRHCLYGQSFQLQRAITELGDTFNIIPAEARQSCATFKNQMRAKYGDEVYKGCLTEGRMFASDAEYAAALENYLARCKFDKGASTALRDTAIADFARRNFSIDDVEAGSVLIVPRVRGARNMFHAIMYLGRGYIRDGEFVADNAGRPMFAGYNKEGVNDLFRTYDTSNVFAVDIKAIARIQYAQELARIKAMSREELVQFLAARGSDLSADAAKDKTRQFLVNAACAKYLGDDNTHMIMTKPIELAMVSQNAARAR